ncbi:nitroreductase [Bermanella sp. R86510]|uniref:nitroreductase family protein n=1 Tax=unclassified Bermanella TaxID=2627862 RepID=UPI0037C67358
MNKVIELLQNRASSPKLMAPAPNQEELEQILKCALRAPDHGRLKPWRFHILQGEQLKELGELFAEAVQKDEQPEVKVEKCRNMPQRAPMMIVASCHPFENPKIPQQEQVLAVGAAIQNMQIAISSLGYASIWRTGEMAYHPHIEKAFGVPNNGQIVGFIYIGTAAAPLTAPETTTAEYVTNGIKP